jgi:hypothetical protein
MAPDQADEVHRTTKETRIMPITRPWTIVGAAAAVTGLGIGAGVAGSDGIDLQDRTDPVELTSTPAGVRDAPADDSPKSADSPATLVADSADSPNDSPGDAGWVDPSPESADSPDDSPFDSPPPPAPAPASAASANSPAAPSAPAPAPVSADSPPSPESAESADSPESAASHD